MNRPNGHISRESFDALYADYKPRFVRIAQSYVRNGMVAEDIVTDSFLYLWEHRAELTITASLPAYVLGAVKHGCLEWLRNEKNRLNIRQQIHTTAYHSIQARITALEACDPGQLFASEVAAIVQEEIARMPEPMRSIFVASRFDGKTYHCATCGTDSDVSMPAAERLSSGLDDFAAAQRDAFLIKFI